MPNLFTLVLQIAVILAVCRVVGTLFKKFQQPRVVGEMFAGIMLGPSLLGWIAPNFSSYLFPPSSLGFLNALSQVGVVIFMFLVGLGINPKELKSHGHAAVLTSHVSITAPFVLASFLAIYLYPRLSDDSVPFTTFALFMIYGVQRLLRRFESTYRERGQLSDNAMALMMLLALGAALCTEWLG